MAIANVPDATQPMFDKLESKYGFVPNMMQEMGKSPALLGAYMQGQAAMQNSALKAREQQVIQLAVSQVYECPYCLGAHGAAVRQNKVDESDIEVIINGGLPKDERLANLVQAARLIQKRHARLSEEEFQDLEAKGIDRRQVYDIIALIALKVMTTMVDHASHLELDQQFGG